MIKESTRYNHGIHDKISHKSLTQYVYKTYTTLYDSATQGSYTDEVDMYLLLMITTDRGYGWTVISNLRAWGSTAERPPISQAWEIYKETRLQTKERKTIFNCFSN